MSLLGFGRLSTSLAVLDMLHLGSSMSLRSFSRVASSLSIIGTTRFGASFSVVDYMNVGSSMSMRSIFRVGSTLSISGSEVSDVPFVLYQPFSIKEMVHFGSSFSLYGALRLGSTLSILCSTNLGSTLSLRSGLRLGSSVSVLEMIHFGASLSLRSLGRLGSALSIFGKTNLAGGLTMEDNLYIEPDQVAKVTGWAIKWNTGTQRLEFLKDGTTQTPISMSLTGGSLHGTWTVESIVSASDRRLKREIWPLAQTLPTKAGGKPTSASDILQALNPIRSFTLPSLNRAKEEPRILFNAEEVEEVLPELVRENPAAPDGETTTPDKGKGILYQDFLALLTLAAQERQKRLEQHRIREQEEILRIQEQESLIEMMERQVDALKGRFTRLRSRNPIPPPV